MYTPSHFQESRPELLHALIAQHSLATLITITSNGFEATHIPLLLENNVLRGHTARNNPIASPAPALAIFHGPQHYISPNYYATKHTVVPTWNYITVHAHGTLRAFESKSELLRVVTQLTDHMESSQPQPWSVNDAPADYIDKMLSAIIGIEIPIDRLEGKWKVSQNRPEADRLSVIDALDGHPMADAVREAL